MKRNLLYILFTVALSGYQLAGVAQNFVIEPDVVTMDVDASDFEGIAHSLVVNNGDQTTDFVWEREILSLSQGWEVAICDKNQCYSWTVGTEEFWLDPAEEGTMDVHVYPFDNEGSAVILVHVWAESDPETVVTGSYYFNTAVSVPERLTEAITLYPNPAENILFIEQGAEEKVARIELYSLSGKMVIDKRISTNNSVEVSALPTGTYVARLYDANDVQLSSNVVIKK